MQGVPEGARRATGWLAMAIVTLSMAAPTTTEYVKLPAGRLASVLAGDADKEPLAIAAFAMRATPVTQREFGRFVQAHPQWRRDRRPRLSQLVALGRQSRRCQCGGATGDAGQLVRRPGVLRGRRRAAADVVGMGVRGRCRRDAPRRARRPGMARSHPRLVLAPRDRAAAEGRRQAQCLRRARPSRCRLGMGRRFQRAARRRRQPHRQRPGQAQVLRRRRDQPAGPRQLRRAHARGAAVFAQRLRQHQQSRLSAETRRPSRCSATP